MPLKGTFEGGLLSALFLAVGGIHSQYKSRLQTWLSRDPDMEVMSGKLYTASMRVVLDNGDHFYFVITTRETCEPLLRYSVEGTSTAEMTVYEGADIEGGEHVDVLNMRREHPNHENCITHSPTVNDYGVSIRHHVLPGGKEMGGGELSPPTRFMLKKNTTYLFDLHNISGEDERVYAATLEIYEAK